MKNNAILSAKDWLVNSGIQNTKGDEIGGFNAWYDLGANEYSYVYSEITGYGITTLLFLNKFYKNGFLERL